MSQELSRRTLLRTGAAAGAAGIAAGSLGVAAVTSSSSGTASSGPAPADAAGAPAASGQDPIVLHVRDARTGEVEIFTGSTVVRVRDSVITSRIRSAL